MKSKFLLTGIIFITAMTGVMLLIGLFAWQAQAATSSVTITVWHQEANTTVLDQIVSDFHTIHPTITVQLEYKSINDLIPQYLLEASTGSGPELVRGPNDWVGTFASDELIRSVDSDFDFNLFVTQTITATLWQGQHWAVPDTYGNHLMLYYNKSLLAAAPVSTTEMISVAQSLTGGGQYGIVYNLNDAFWLIPWFTGYGGWVLDENSNPITPTLNTPAMVNTLQFVHDLRWVHGIVPTGTVDYSTADNLFRNGNAAMIINGDWILGEYRNLFGSNLGVARIPLVADTGKWPQPMTSGKFYYFNANKSGQALEASKLFVEYATSKSAQLLWAQNSVLPALLEAFNDPIVQTDPILQGSAEQARNGRLMPTSPEMNCVWVSMYGQIAGVMDDTATPTQAAAEMQTNAANCAGLLYKNANWKQSGSDGFGDSQYGQIPSLAAFGDYLYAGAQGNNGVSENAQIWRTSNGIGWEKVDDRPSVNGTAALIAFDGYLYAGSWGDSAGSKIWRSSNGIDWTDVITDGFGDEHNGIARFAVFSDTLYASTWNGITGSQIWRTTNGTHWEQFNSGIGSNLNNTGAIASEEFNGYLYWGVENWTTGAQLWRTDGITWTPIITNGFGITENGALSSLAVFNGYLYAGVWNSNSIQVWRSSNGTQWTHVINGEIGSPGTGQANALEVYNGDLYLVSQNDTTGLEVWRTPNGTDWEQVGFAGFGDSNNHWSFFDNAATVFKDKLYIGTNNYPTGGEVWKISQPLNQIYLPLVVRNYQKLTGLLLFSDDFSNSSSGWPVVLGQTSYESGEYRIFSDELGWIPMISAPYPAMSVDNYSVEVDVRKVSGTGIEFGLMFESQPAGPALYQFDINPDTGTYILRKRFSTLASASSAYINPGTSINHLKVERIGSLIKIYVNGHLLTSVTDGTYLHGKVGVTGLNSNTDTTDVRFDNFTVYQLP